MPQMTDKYWGLNEMYVCVVPVGLPSLIFLTLP